MTEARLSFKEMCARFDVTPRTLRYYEYIELLQPERQGRSRFYSARDVARMKLILRGRKFGFQLEEIRQWLLIYENEGNEAQNRAFVEMADRQMEELRKQELFRFVWKLKVKVAPPRFSERPKVKITPLSNENARLLKEEAGHTKDKQLREVLEKLASHVRD